MGKETSTGVKFAVEKDQPLEEALGAISVVTHGLILTSKWDPPLGLGQSQILTTLFNSHTPISYSQLFH